MGTNAQLAGCLQFVVDVVADKIAAWHGHERHIADRGDALLGHAPHLIGVSACDAIFAQPLKAARQQLHGSRFVSNARKLAACVLVVAAARWRLAVARDAERLECAAVEPKRVPVARIHNAGTIGECRIERRLGRMLGRVPTVVAPALRHNPGVIGQVLGKLEQVRRQLRHRAHRLRRCGRPRWQSPARGRNRCRLAR